MKMKYIYYLIGLVLMCAQTQAMDDNKAQEATQIKCKHELRLDLACGDLRARSITMGDAHIVESLVSRCLYKEGLPANTVEKPTSVYEWAKNLINRQQNIEAPNPFSGLLFFDKGEPVAFCVIGVMSALGFGDGYNLQAHLPIVKKFETMGSIRLKENLADVKEPKSTKAIYESVDGSGMCDLLPVIPNLSKQLTIDVLRMAVDSVQHLRNMGQRLPRGENTVPGYVIGLFHPEDPLLPHLKAVGFKIDENPGFVEFYPPKQRVLASIKLK